MNIDKNIGVDFEMVRKSISYPSAKYLKQFDDYIASFEKMNPEIAQKKAKQSLTRSGILTKNGKIKKSIVTRK